MKVQYDLEIESGNAAFGDNEAEARAEVVRLLRLAADKLEQGTTYTVLYDYNGNRVGDAGFHAEDDT